MEWARSAEAAFRVSPQYFPDDRVKCAWASQSLRGKPSEAWAAKFQELSYANLEFTWTQFIEFLENLIVDPENRDLRYAQRMEDAYQRKGQDVKSFAVYLQTLENHLPAAAPVNRRNTFLTKLRPEIRAEINVQGGRTPQDFEELVSFAVRVESGIKMRSNLKSKPSKDQDKEEAGESSKKIKHTADDDETPSRRFRGSSRGRSRGRGYRGSRPRRPPTDDAAASTSTYMGREVTCYTCKKPGHISPNCPESNPNRISTGESQPKKGQASSEPLRRRNA